MEEYTLVDQPLSRVATFDVGKISRKKHEILGLVEVNVTEVKKRIKEKIRAGEKVSFLSWLVKAAATTIAEIPEIQAINYRRKRQVIFRDVDISFPLEKTVNGRRVPLVMVLRQANRKSIEEIRREMEEALSREIESEKDYVLEKRKTERWNRLFFRSPQWFRMLCWKVILRNPFQVKRNIGTAIITNIGMKGNAPGWIIPKTIHNLALGIGTITKKPCIIEGKVAVGDILHLAVIINHDSVDGVPAAKFTEKLIRNLEKGAGL